MPSKTLWSATGAFTTLIDGVTAAPTLKNLASAGNKLGNAYDNSTASTKRDQYATFRLHVRGAVAFTAGSAVFVWLLTAADGATYEDGDDSTTPARPPDLVFSLRAVATQQNIDARGYVPPGLFKPLVQNNGGQAFTNTDSENVLSFAVVDDEAQ